MKDFVLILVYLWLGILIDLGGAWAVVHLDLPWSVVLGSALLVANVGALATILSSGRVLE